MAYLVTGGLGFLGTHLVKDLSDLGHEVILFDNFESNGKPIESDRIVHVMGDLCDRSSLENLMKTHDISGVFHLAALKSVSQSVLFPAEYQRINVRGTESLISACTAAMVKNIIFTSSAAVYGTVNQASPILESSDTKPVTPYGETKLGGEKLLRKFVQERHGSAVALRCFNIGGIREKAINVSEAENVIPIIIRKIRQAETFELFGSNLKTNDGSPIRDYVHVSDVSNALILAMSYLESGITYSFDILNICTQIGISVRELIDGIEVLSHKKLMVEVKDKRNGEADSVVGSLAHASAILGWAPKRSIKDILNDSWNNS